MHVHIRTCMQQNFEGGVYWDKLAETYNDIFEGSRIMRKYNMCTCKCKDGQIHVHVHVCTVSTAHDVSCMIMYIPATIQDHLGC